MSFWRYQLRDLGQFCWTYLFYPPYKLYRWFFPLCSGCDCRGWQIFSKIMLATAIFLLLGALKAADPFLYWAIFLCAIALFIGTQEEISRRHPNRSIKYSEWRES